MLLAEAVAAAGAAEAVVMVLGLPNEDESEGFDRTHLALPANQLAALEAVAAANPRVAVVLVNGSIVLLDAVTAHAQAILECWLGGQAGGAAIADLVVGRANPSGRLAETVPLRLEDNSSYLNFPGDSGVVRYGEGLFVGYRGYDAQHLDVAYPFGFGLSYTAFELSDLAVTTTGAAADGDLAARVAVTVTNTGAVAGAEVVQVYVRDVEASVARPVRELKGFAKVHLEPGASQQVVVELDQRAFSFWSTVVGRWVVEAGDVVVEVGRSSRDLPLQQVLTLDAPRIAGPIRAGSTLQEWLADPVARELLEGQFAAGAAPIVGDPELVRVIGNMPMSTLANFGPMSLDPDTLDALAEQWAARTGS